MTKPGIFSAAATTIAAASLTGAANAQAATNNSDGKPAKNVVLVHGAFADGSGWRGVYDELTSRGYRVTIVQNPLTSLADDVAATHRALARQDGPTILVGHSWGGTVITEAGIDPKVVALVYVSALSPDAGETTAEQYAGFTTPPEFVIETLPGRLRHREAGEVQGRLRRTTPAMPMPPSCATRRCRSTCRCSGPSSRTPRGARSRAGRSSLPTTRPSISAMLQAHGQAHRREGHRGEGQPCVVHDAAQGSCRCDRSGCTEHCTGGALIATKKR